MASRRRATLFGVVAMAWTLAIVASTPGRSSAADVLASSPGGGFVTGPLARAVRRAQILVPGDLVNQDCRTGVCKHNENTALTRWRDDVWLVHRTAGSQV